MVCFREMTPYRFFKKIESPYKAFNDAINSMTFHRHNSMESKPTPVFYKSVTNILNPKPIMAWYSFRFLQRGTYNLVTTLHNIENCFWDSLYWRHETKKVYCIMLYWFNLILSHTEIVACKEIDTFSWEFQGSWGNLWTNQVFKFRLFLRSDGEDVE